MSRSLPFVLYPAAAVLIIAGLRYAQPFLVPVLFAASLAAITSPIATWVTRRGLPAAAGALAALVVDITLLGVIAVTLTLAGSELREKLPGYLARLTIARAALVEALSARGIHVDASSLRPDGMGFLGDAAVTVVGAASTMAVVLVVVFFMLCEFTGLGDKIRANFADPARGLARVDRIVREVQTYLLVKTLTCFLSAVLIFILLKLLRMELALFLGLSVFVLHFIPNVGPLIGNVLAVMVALASRGPGTAVAVAIGYVVIAIAVGTVLEPRLLGRTLGLSPLVVLLGMLFWGWLWGAPGALLSVPLMVVAKATLENSRDLVWIARLLEPATDESEPAKPSRGASLNPLLVRPSVPIGLGATPKTQERRPTVFGHHLRGSRHS